LLALHPARDGERLVDELQRKLKKAIDTVHAKVTTRPGHVVFRIPASALFPSGDAKVNQPGGKALAEIASVLSSMSGPAGERFQVAGHAPGAKSPQWGLCAQRAMAVAERLAAGGVAARTISVAAFGTLDPETRSEPQGIEICVLRGDASSAVLVENR
jgi:flagellar motor protein MotB